MAVWKAPLGGGVAVGGSGELIGDWVGVLVGRGVGEEVGVGDGVPVGSTKNEEGGRIRASADGASPPS